MKKVVLQEFGGPEVLHWVDYPDPICPEDGWVVETRAIGLNFAEVVERRGQYRRDQKTPYEMGKEASGIICEKGPSAEGFEVGDAVIVVKFNNGCYGEKISAVPGQVLLPPEGFSFAEMSSFANTWATAWLALEEMGRVRPGESALIQAAAGGVGTAAVLLARSLGMAPIIGTAGTHEKCRLVESLGASRCVDYTSEDFRGTVTEITKGRGVDWCLESVGGEVYERSLESLGPTGRLVLIGFSSLSGDYSEQIPRLHPLTLFHRSISVSGLNVDKLDYPTLEGCWDSLVKHVNHHGLRPVIGPSFSFSDIVAAHTALESRNSTGKVVLEVDAS
ncbi:MAG TPA: hypothetical protein DDW23_08820 [Planctomycetes bacterium]|nr:hypothetical protein [Planctomycetota bacterium]